MEVIILLFILAVIIAIPVGLMNLYKASVEETKKEERRVRALQISDIDIMAGIEFEHYVAKLLVHRGFQAEVTKGSSDLGVDIVAQKNARKYAIQVKRYTKNVSRRAVSDAVAGMNFWGCNAAMVITNRFFTSGAQQLAHSTNCELVDRAQLAEWIADFHSE